MWLWHRGANRVAQLTGQQGSLTKIKQPEILNEAKIKLLINVVIFKNLGIEKP
jgi:hypothetical protein